MTDRELLEAAAKAAGYTDAKWQDMEGWGEVRYGMSEGVWTGRDYWNPLTDDGDALRLAVRLGLFFKPEFFSFLSLERFAGQEHDDGHATRCAIVRAAAALAPKE